MIVENSVGDPRGIITRERDMSNARAVRALYAIRPHEANAAIYLRRLSNSAALGKEEIMNDDEAIHTLVTSFLTAPPFSFTYGGAPFASVREAWATSERRRHL